MLTQPQSDRVCPACQAEASRELARYSQPPWEMAVCSNCDFVYLKNPPGYEALIEEYSWEKTSAKETERRLESRPGAKMSKATHWRLSLFRNSARQLKDLFASGDALDIGCGSGGRLLEAGCVPHGIEISRELHQQADERMREKGGYCVHAPAVEGIKQFPDEMFDSVLMHSFLEHEENPGPLIEETFRTLKPGGFAYVRVPNYGSINRKVTGAKWCGFRYPDHVNYFTVDSLKRMAAKSGFGFKLLNPLNIALDDNIKALLLKP